MNKSYFTRKEQIILSAIEIIDELGIDGLSIRELAKKENITEGALYRHFKSKNDIIIDVITYYSHFDINIMNTIIKNKLDSKSAITFFINSFSEYYENYPEITAVYSSFESLIYQPIVKKTVFEVVNRRFIFLKSIIDEGKTNGEINSCINSESIADIITGTYRQIVLKWRYEKYKFPLKKKSLDLINMILKSVIPSL